MPDQSNQLKPLYDEIYQKIAAAVSSNLVFGFKFLQEKFDNALVWLRQNESDSPEDESLLAEMDFMVRVLRTENLKLMIDDYQGRMRDIFSHIEREWSGFLHKQATEKSLAIALVEGEKRLDSLNDHVEKNLKSLQARAAYFDPIQRKLEPYLKDLQSVTEEATADALEDEYLFRDSYAFGFTDPLLGAGIGGMLFGWPGAALGGLMGTSLVLSSLSRALDDDPRTLDILDAVTDQLRSGMVIHWEAFTAETIKVGARIESAIRKAAKPQYEADLNRYLAKENAGVFEIFKAAAQELLATLNKLMDTKDPQTGLSCNEMIQLAKQTPNLSK